jgi:uncharacterized metal-binding protein
MNGIGSALHGAEAASTQHVMAVMICALWCVNMCMQETHVCQCVRRDV